MDPTHPTHPEVLALIDLAREGRHVEIMGITGATTVSRTTRGDAPSASEGLALYGSDAHGWLISRGARSRDLALPSGEGFSVGTLVVGAWQIDAFGEVAAGHPELFGGEE